MSANTFGKLFCVTTFGESHGAAIGCIIDGCPPDLLLSEADIQPELDRRRPGTSRFVTQRREPDTVRILSGVYEGKTTGTPIALLIENQDQRSKDYGKIAQVFRPGHADYTYWMKYGIRDPRGGGRSSARLTAVTVAAAAVAKKWLKEHYGIQINGCMSQMGRIVIPFSDWSYTEKNAFFAANGESEILKSLEDELDALRKAGDSVGARVQIQATHMPVGLGSPLFSRLDGEIASAMMSINAVKGVEIGDGFDAVMQKGSEHGDEMSPKGFKSNHSGGILGGISSGQDLRVSIAVKPTPSIHLARETIDICASPQTIQTEGRHDPCVGIRAVPVAEAMLALVLMDAALMHRAQCNDVQVQTPPIVGTRA